MILQRRTSIPRQISTDVFCHASKSVDIGPLNRYKNRFFEKIARGAMPGGAFAPKKGGLPLVSEP